MSDPITLQMMHARDNLDAVFGSGTGQRNPELVLRLLQVQQLRYIGDALSALSYNNPEHHGELETMGIGERAVLALEELAKGTLEADDRNKDE